MANNSGHRMGGRNARKAKRAAALPENMKPVRPGQEGGLFKPLKAEDLPKINEAVLEVLETIGMDKAIPSCIEACTKKGCTVSTDGRLLIPRSVVKESLAKAGRDITLYGASPEHDLQLSGKKVHFGTAGAAVHMLDPINRKYRESTTADLFDIARVCDSLEHIHFFQRSIVCRDLEDVREMDFNTCYASRKCE
jgi:trimethylamine--corrinoid protein Co-methyltransferase